MCYDIYKYKQYAQKVENHVRDPDAGPIRSAGIGDGAGDDFAEYRKGNKG